MPKLNALHNASAKHHSVHPKILVASDEHAPVDDAIALGNDIVDLLSSCREREGILTTTDIPHKLRNRLSSDEQYKVLAWMKKRQNVKR
jgi:hypothetical protein